MKCRGSSTRTGHAMLLSILGAACLIATVLPAQNADAIPPPGGQQVPQPVAPPAFQPIQKPTDPNKVRGTYEIGGATVEVTEGQFYDTYLLLKPNEERPNLPLQPQRVLEHILLLAEAEAMGFGLTAEEMALVNPLAVNPTFASQLRERWKAQGISEEEYLRYLAQTRAIQRLKDWHTTGARVRSSEIFDLWKRDNFLYRIAYLEFPAKPFETELRRSVPDEATLKTFWSSNTQVQEKYRTATSVTADIVIFDPREVTEAEITKRRGDRRITKDEALAYFVKNRERLLAQIPSDQRPKLYPPPGTKPAVKDLVTPFDILRDTIEREMILGDRISQGFAEAATVQDSAGMKALAQKHGLRHVRLERADRRVMLQDYPQLGHQLFTDLFNAPPGSLSPAIQYQGSLQFFWRLEDKAVATLPPFEQIREKLAEDWYQQESYRLAQAAAKEVIDAVDQAVAKESTAAESKIDQEQRDAAEQEIVSKNVSDDRQKDAIRQKAAGVADSLKRKIRTTLAPKYFESTVAEKKLTLKTLPPFSFMAQQVDRTSITDPQEQIKAFLMTSYQIRAMENDQISPILSDIVTNSHFVVKLLGKEEPTFELMPPIEYHQRRLAVERQSMYSSNYRWTLFQVQKRRNWKEK